MSSKIQAREELGEVKTEVTASTIDNKRGLDVSLLGNTIKVDNETLAQSELASLMSRTINILEKIEVHLQVITGEQTL